MVSTFDKVLFLDIDGVLNDTPCVRNGRPRIEYSAARQLDRVVRFTGAAIVLSSAWRGWVHQCWMTCEGLEVLLGTHGIWARVVDVLPEGDKLTQMRRWIDVHRPASYVAVDDEPLAGVRQVRTNGQRGLTVAEADELIRKLGRGDEDDWAG